MNHRPATTDDLLSHADWVRRLSRALLCDPNEAEDVAQDAWVAALKRPPAAGTGMRAWWARVVRNSASNRRRSELRRADREQRVASERAEATDPHVESTLEAHRRLASAIDSLDEPLRNVIVEHYFHGATSRQIAEREGVAESTIRTRLQKALEKLRRELDERAGGDRRVWAALLAPLAALEHAAVPAVLIAGWIKFAASLAFVGLAGAAAYEFFVPRSAPLEIAAAPSEPAPAPAVSLSEAASAPDRAQQPPAAQDPAPSAPVEPLALVDARVLDARGIPIRLARVVYTLRSDPANAPRAESDATGRVELSIPETDPRRGQGRRAGLPPGTWDGELIFSCPGHETLSLYATLVLGQRTSLGDVVLGDGADLSGRCLASDGRPLARASVELIEPDLSLEDRRYAERGNFYRSGRTRRVSCAADGTYRMPGAPVGHWRVAASAEGLACALSEPFALAAGEQRVLPDLVLPECASAIRGRVLGVDGEPFGEAEIEYSFGARDEFVGTRGEKDGSFTLEGIGSDEVDIFARSVRGDTGEAARLGVRPGEIGVVLRIPEPRHFEVRVVDPEGRPVEKCSLGIYCADGTGGGGSNTASEGVFTCTARARPFRVTVLVDGYAPLEQGLFTQQDVPAQLEFRLPRCASVRGRVLRAGVPQPYLEVHLDARLESPRQRVDGMPCLASKGPCSITQADGSFGLGALRGGTYALWVSGRHGAIECVRMLEFDGAAPVEGLDVELEQAGVIEGVVESSAPTRSRAAQVLFSCGVSDPRAERIAPDGTFRIEGLSPGRWWLRVAPDTRTDSGLLASGSECDAGCVVIDVRAGETQHCRFDVREPDARVLRGQVSLGKRAPAGWVATLAAESGGGWARESSCVLAETGDFALAPRGFGPQLLHLRAPGTAARDDIIEVRLLVPAEGRKWTLECELGGLELEGAPGVLVQIVADLPNGATWTTHAILGASGRAALDALPAVKVRVSTAGSKDSPVEVEIPAGARAASRCARSASR